MKTTNSLVALALILILIATSCSTTSAITCYKVFSSLSPCLNYVQDGNPTVPPKECCAGCQKVMPNDSKLVDKQKVCECLKTVASSAGSGPAFDRAASIPSQCDVSLSYKLAPDMDCSQIN